jgi:hypothetical protein
VKMGFSVNPLEILKLFRDKGIADRAAIASYVERIAQDVKNASDCWWHVIDCLRAGTAVDPVRNREREYFCDTIDYHYAKASSVIDADLAKDLAKELFDALGAEPGPAMRRASSFWLSRTIAHVHRPHHGPEPDRANRNHIKA